MNIVVVSDNHKDYLTLRKILNDNPGADYYFHLGDSEMDIEDIAPFAGVRGNVDYDYSFPYDRIIDIKGHSFYLIHGNSYSGDPKLLAQAGKLNDCDVVLFGHTHCFMDEEINGIRLINPGSCSRQKDGTPNSYAIIEIDESGAINVRRINLN